MRAPGSVDGRIAHTWMEDGPISFDGRGDFICNKTGVDWSWGGGIHFGVAQILGVHKAGPTKEQLGTSCGYRVPMHS